MLVEILCGNHDDGETEIDVLVTPQSSSSSRLVSSRLHSLTRLVHLRARSCLSISSKQNTTAQHDIAPVNLLEDSSKKNRDT